MALDFLKKQSENRTSSFWLEKAKEPKYKPPSTKIGFFDVLKEIPSSTKKVATSIARFGKSVQEEIAKSGASVGLTLAYPFTKKYEITSKEIEEKLSPEARRFKEHLFGKDPLKSLQTRIAEAEIKLPTGEALPFGVKAPKELAIPGVTLMVGLDFTGWGGGKKQVIKILTKLNKADDIAKVLKKLNVADDLIYTYSKVLAKTNKADEVIKTLDNISDIQKTTKPKVSKIIPKERQFLQSVSQARPDVPLRISGQYIPRSTDDLAIRAKNLIKTDINTAENLVRTGTDEKAVATASELIKHYSDEALKTTSQAIKNTLYDKAGEIAHIAAANLTEQGRAVQAASIMGRLTPEGILRFAAQEINKYNEMVTKSRWLKKKMPQLTSEQTKNILNEFKRIEAMEDGTKKAMAFRKLTDSIQDLIPSSLYKKIINVWKAGLLTGLKTSGLNIFSNLFHGTSEVIKDIPGIVVDSMASWFTGKRTLALTAKKTPQGIQEGFEKGWRYLKTGFDERNVAIKLDWRRVNFGKSKIAKGIQKYEETIFHILGAEDQPFYYGAKARSLMSQSIAQAKNKGLKGKEAQKFIYNLIENPTDDMLRYATNDAEMSVFQNPTTLGKIAKGIQNLPGGELIVPFGRTPSAVANQLINYSPVGIVKAIAQNIGKGKFDQRLFSQAMGRGITGTGIMYLGTELFKKGIITLNYPKGEREQKLWEIEGRKPNSIKVGNKWRSVNILGPAGMVLLTGGYFQESLEENGSVFRAFVDSTAGGAKSLTEQTFLRGVNQFTEALNDPDRFFEGWFSNTASSVIPTIIKDVATAFDPSYRRTEDISDRLKAKIPGVRQTLEPRITVLGEERARGGNWLETMIDPSRPTKIITGNVVEELRRLTDVGYRVSPTLLGDKAGYKGLTPQENTALWEKTGEFISSKLNNLLNLEQYKNLPDDKKADLIETVVSKSKTIARVQAVMDITEGLSGQELKDKLSELKTGGLMTRQVFNKYLELRY